MSEAFGLTLSSVSLRFILASTKELHQLAERLLYDTEWLLLVLDKKAFTNYQLLISLYVTATNEKLVLVII